MWILVIFLLCTSYIHQQCCGIKFIDLPETEEMHRLKPLIESKQFNTNQIEDTDTENKVQISPAYPPVRSTTPTYELRRHWAPNQKPVLRQISLLDTTVAREDEKDENLKNKISTLVQQTIHDTERKIKSVQHIKEVNRDQPPYKIGFVLSMVKKSRDVLNELFNVAVKHRDEWKALEQLKIFELIVHTNVDTTNLVRQLVEIHIQHLNSTSDGADKKRVVLL